MPTRRLFSLLLFASLLAAPALASAQGSDAKAAAQALFDDGRRLMEEGKLAEACRKLEGSQKLDPGAGTLLNLAACYERNGQTASAWVTYKDAAAASAERHPDWVERANEKAAALEPVLSRLTIAVAAETPGLEVVRDGVTVAAGVLGAALPVDPGPHTIVARAPGYERFEVTVTVGPSKDQQTVTVPALTPEARPDAGAKAAPAPVIAPPPRGPDAGGDRGSTQRAAGIVGVGLGVVGLGVGGIWGAIAMGKKSDAGDPAYCTSDLSRCNAEGVAMIDDARSAATISTIGFVAGGVLAAGGLVLFLTAPSNAPSGASAHRPAVALRAGTGPAGAPLGLSLAGAFQ